MKSDINDLDQLALACGIAPEYCNYQSQMTTIGEPTKRALLASLGHDTSSEAATRESLRAMRETDWQQVLEPVTVIREDRTAMLRLTVPLTVTHQHMIWELALENGELMEGRVLLGDRQPKAYRVVGDQEYRRYLLQLPQALPVGYHDFELQIDGGPVLASARLIVAPQRCYQPPALVEGERHWGFAAQLYTLRTEDNWGIGDLGDLKALVRLAAEQGADYVGLNPLHALFPDKPAHNSPYSPSSRAQLNILYIAVPDVPEYPTCQGAQSLVASPGFRQRLEQARATAHVAYEEVAALKMPVLRKLYRHFRERHLARTTGRAQAFERYVAQMGEGLYLHALYDALHEHFYSRDSSKDGWQQWPTEFHDPLGSAARDFAERERESVEFYQYLQWLTDEQLAGAQRSALQAGMGIGVYRDLAVGVDSDGAETWANQALYCLDMRVGAPPDPLALKGQDWGLPPMDPFALKTRGYRDFISLLRTNMRHCGALRMDHVMALLRVWWLPKGSDPSDGAYLGYPLADLLGILALESQRNQCMVIGEDLGVVPEQIREPLQDAAVYSYRVAYFEQDAAGQFKPPEGYPLQALCTVTTHDLPTFCAYWEGLDLKLRESLDMFPGEAVREETIARRAADRHALLRALAAHLSPAQLQALQQQLAEGAVADTPWALTQAVHQLLATSQCSLMAVALEDLLQIRTPVNVPGTSTEHRNWSRKLNCTLAQMFSQPAVRALCALVNRARREGLSESPPQVQ